jgi:uncharacterized membrane protein YccC
MTLPTRSDWLFSIKAFAAAMLALYVALCFDLPRPYWAMAAVYVVANPLAGATTSKALYRALGTLIGAAAAVVFLPLFVNAPLLLALVVALWTGTLLYISMLDRTPRSYVFMLAGYSLPLIALPLVDSPGLIFDTAVARSEEIIIGIICASLVSTTVFPSSVSKVLTARIALWLDDARHWGSEILKGEGATARTPLLRQKLAADLSALDLFLTQIAYDAGSRNVARQARRLRQRLLMLLPILSSLADRLNALKAVEENGHSDLRALLADLEHWIAPDRQSSAIGAASSFRTRIETLKRVAVPSRWERLIRIGALSRLEDLIDLLEDCDALRTQVAAERADKDWRGLSRFVHSERPARHYDYPLMLFSAGVVVAGILLAIALWIMTGWGSGAGFVTMMAVACSFFAAIDRPAPFIKLMFLWTTASIFGAGAYLFVVLPMVHDFPTLVLAFAGPFLLIGLLIPRPQFNIIAMLLTVNMASYVALQDRFSADFASFANEGLAAAMGVGFALVWTLVTRPFGEELAASRLVRSGWADLADAAASGNRYDHDLLSGRLLDRLGQLVPRFAKMDGHELTRLDGLAEVRIGFNIVELQRDRANLSAAQANFVDNVLAGIASFFRSKVRIGISAEPTDVLLATIDRAIEALAVGDAEKEQASLNALVGLRRAVFPLAAPPSESDAELQPGTLLHAAE